MTDDWEQDSRYTPYPEEMSQDVRKLISSFTKKELDIEYQIDQLEELISMSDPEMLLEKVCYSLIFGGWVSAQPVPDDTVGLPPSLGEYVIGKIIASEEYGNQEPDFQKISELAHSISQAYSFGGMKDIDPNEMSETELSENSLKHSLQIREIGSGRFMFDLQVEDAIKRAYSPHDKYLRDLNGFTAKQSIDFLKFLLLLIEKSLNDACDKSNFNFEDVIIGKNSAELMLEEYQEDGLKKIPNRREVKIDAENIEDAYEKLGKYQKNIWLPEEKAVEYLPSEYDVDAFNSFIDRLGFDLYENSADFRKINDFNPIRGYPIIRANGKLLIPQMAKARQSLLDTFYYDLINHPEYGDPDGDTGGEFGNKWGDYIEEWAYDSLVNVYGENNVFLNPEYDSTNSEEAADLVVLYNDYLMVFECKSKKLVLQSRGGNISRAKEDLDTGIGSATDQALEFIQHVKSNQTTNLKTKNKTVLINRDSVKNIIPCVVIGEEYDMISIDEFNHVLELEETPFVVSVYNLEIICELLEKLDLVKYIIDRIELSVNNDIASMDELDLLGLFIDEGYQFPDVEDNHHLQVMDYTNHIAAQLDYKFGP